MQIVLITHDPDLSEYRNEQLVRRLRKRGVDVRILAPGQEIVRLKGGRITVLDARGRELNPDLVVNGLFLNTGRGLDLVRVFEAAGHNVVNRADPWYYAKMKHLAGAILSAAGIPHPSTVFSHGAPRGLRRQVRRLGRRVVFKPWDSALGTGSVRYRRERIFRATLRRWLRRHQSVYAQAFVRNPGRDIRALVVGGDVLGATYRYAPRGKWKTNVAAGGRPANCRVTEPIRQLSLAATRALGLDIAGVDLIEGPDGLQILELNAWPNYRRYDETVGIDVADRLAQYLQNRALGSRFSR